MVGLLELKTSSIILPYFWLRSMTTIANSLKTTSYLLRSQCWTKPSFSKDLCKEVFIITLDNYVGASTEQVIWISFGGQSEHPFAVLEKGNRDKHKTLLLHESGMNGLRNKSVRWVSTWMEIRWINSDSGQFFKGQYTQNIIWAFITLIGSTDIASLLVRSFSNLKRLTNYFTLG